MIKRLFTYFFDSPVFLTGPEWRKKRQAEYWRRKARRLR